jgi:hypothetical protein
MSYTQGGVKLGILWVGAAVFLFLLISGMPVAYADDNFPTLAGGKVTPENGVWGSTFVFEITYTNPDNIRPAENYPRVYIDGETRGRPMVENDPADNDVTDGKAYKYDWETAKENVGSHNFYFYVETPTGENAATDTDNGPLVNRPAVSLSCEVDNPEPVIGKNVTFSGSLKTTEENLALAGKNITIYKLLLNDNTNVGSATTDENGHFTFAIEAPGPGIFCYIALFSGDNYYETSESSIAYVNTLNKSMVFGAYAVILLVLVGVMMILFSWRIPRAQYLKPVLLGFTLGFLLLLLGAGFIGILAGGAIAGYLFARENPKWTKHLRIGCMTGFLFLLGTELIISFFLIWSPNVLGLPYSLIQTDVFELLFSDIVFSSVYYVLWVAIGAMLGGMLRKLLKPAEQKPVTVAGPATTAASG